MATEMIRLDTSVLIDVYDKTDKSKSFFYKLTGKYRLFAVSAITASEFMQAVPRSRITSWDKFFQTISVLPFDNDVNKTAIEIQRQLKRELIFDEFGDFFWN